MRVLVVGGGITGLAAARALARDGLSVTLVEAGPTLGGKVATERADGFVLEHGPDSFCALHSSLCVTVTATLNSGNVLDWGAPSALGIAGDG